MKIEPRSSIFTELSTFCHLAGKHDFMEITEWSNGEGYDVATDKTMFRITHGELTAINTLVNLLEHPTLMDDVT